MKHKLTKNLSLKLLSLIVAFLIWLIVGNVDNPVNYSLYKDIKIQIANEDSVTEIDKVFNIVSDETVVLKVKERQNVLARLSRDDFTVTADLENLTEMDTVPLTVTCRDPAVTWDEIEISPSSMKVKLEQRKQSEFVVNVTTTGNPSKGHEVGRTEVVQGKTVQIAGSESMVNRISQVVATVNVSGINADQRLNGDLKIIDKNGDTMTEAQMSRLQIKDPDGLLLSDKTVMVDVYLWDVMNDVPVQVEVVGELPDGYRLVGVSTVPVTVNVVGTAEALARLDGKIVLKDKISLDGVTESFTQDFDINETLEENEELRMVADAAPTVTVSVQIEKSDDYTLSLPLSNLEVLNRPNNMSLTFSPADEISMVVHSDNGDGPIKVSDIKASIDLGVCIKEGTYEIPVEIELPDGYTLGSDVVLVVTAEKAPQPSAKDTGEE